MSQLRFNLDAFAQALKSAGLKHIVVSPGSRNAPIVAGFLRIGGFELLSAPDERSAAYMAMGAGMATGKAAAAICTSGTAVLNFYPAVCEAFYQQIPLLAITADRPEYMIDRWDGQTIHQKNIFEPHIQASLQIEQDLHCTEALEEIRQIAFKALHIANGTAKGPVHINVPIEEPIYDGIADEVQIAALGLPPAEEIKIKHTGLPAEVKNAENLMVICGQMPPDDLTETELRKVSQKIPVLADVLANVTGKNIVTGTENAENFMFSATPDVLITCGMSLVSKSLKEWIRKNKPQYHFHISRGGMTGDPFFTNPQTIATSPQYFFSQLADFLEGKPSLNFSDKVVEQKITSPQNETELVQLFMQQIDENTAIHLGNSMCIRYANGIKELRGKRFGNRGTSGIDGSVSTAVGYAWAAPENAVLCISGDIGFLYDKNALWCNPLPQNLKIAIINNHGGLIFDKIKGPGELKELRPYINTPQHYNLKSIAEHYSVDFQSVLLNNVTPELITSWISSKTTSIIEIKTT